MTESPEAETKKPQPTISSQPSLNELVKIAKEAQSFIDFRRRLREAYQ